MAAKDDAVALDVTLDDFADVVEQQNDMMKEVLTSGDPAAVFLRSMFSEGFLESKIAETEKYVADLRAEGDADAVQE